MKTRNELVSHAKKNARHTNEYFRLFSELKNINREVMKFYESMQLGVLLIDHERKCLDINAQALNLIGAKNYWELENPAKLTDYSLFNWNIISSEVDKYVTNITNSSKVNFLDSFGNFQEIRVKISSEFLPTKKDAPIKIILTKSRFDNWPNQHNQYAELAFESRVGICIAKQSGEIIISNTALQKILGLEAAELKGKKFYLAFNESDQTEFIRNHLSKSDYFEKYDCEIQVKNKEGKAFTGLLSISLTKTKDPEISYYVIFLQDITEAKSTQEQIYNLAYFDPLTHLPNRRKLIDRLSRLLNNTKNGEKFSSLLFIDLDNFKSVNDSKGHAAGDHLLIEVSRRLKQLVREFDTVARLGGDEFVILLGEIGIDQISAANNTKIIADKIIFELAKPHLIENVNFRCGASIGVAIFNGNESSDEIFKHADMAMYSAKMHGRDSIKFFDLALEKLLTESAEIEHSLHRAIEKNELELYFQPQFDSDSKIKGAEALVRWNHPIRGLITPENFIHIAEKSGVVTELDFWVIETACRKLVSWRNIPYLNKIKLSINISTKQFDDSQFADKIREILQRTDASGEYIKFELTENIRYEMDAAKEIMNDIKDSGISFSLDDFGTGYSSLSSLAKLPINQVKIDKSFIDNMMQSSRDRTVVKAIAALAKNLGLELVAEGIQSTNQIDFLNGVGCDLFQGYILSPPLDGKAFESLMQSENGK